MCMCYTCILVNSANCGLLHVYKTRNITACQREGNIIIIVKPPLFPKIQEYNVGYMYTDTLWTNELSISLTKGLKVSYHYTNLRFVRLSVM